MLKEDLILKLQEIPGNPEVKIDVSDETDFKHRPCEIKLVLQREDGSIMITADL